MYLFIVVILLNLILSVVSIDPRIFRIGLPLIYTKGGREFLELGYSAEYNAKPTWVNIFFVKILVILYILFSVPCNLLYVLFTSHKYESPWYKQFYTIANNPLLIPHAECSWLSGIWVAYTNTPFFIQLQNKLYWNDLFIQHSVPTPTIVGYIISKKVTKNLHFSNKETYIIKPLVGGCGSNISAYNEAEIPSTGEYIIQKRVEQKTTKGHFRIITLYDTTQHMYSIVNTYMCINKPDTLTSNGHTGGICYDTNLEENTVRDMLKVNTTNKLSDFFSREFLNKAFKNALYLHQQLPKYVITVGWDVMLTDVGYFFLEGNVPHGTVLTNDSLYYTKATAINTMIYNSIFS